MRDEIKNGQELSTEELNQVSGGKIGQQNRKIKWECPKCAYTTTTAFALFVPKCPTHGCKCLKVSNSISFDR